MGENIGTNITKLITIILNTAKKVDTKTKKVSNQGTKITEGSDGFISADDSYNPTVKNKDLSNQFFSVGNSGIRDPEFYELRAELQRSNPELFKGFGDPRVGLYEFNTALKMLLRILDKIDGNSDHQLDIKKLTEKIEELKEGGKLEETFFGHVQNELNRIKFDRDNEHFLRLLWNAGIKYEVELKLKKISS